MMESTAIAQVPLGHRGMHVNEYSLGCAPLGNMPVTPANEDVGQAMLEAAWSGGIRTFDVAPFYGLGQGEIRLGRFLASRRRDDYVVSTKVGRLLREDSDGSVAAVFDFSREGILTSLEESLTRLQIDRVDIALIHDPDRHFEAAMKEAYPVLEELRATGVVRAIGLGMNQAGMLEQFVRETDIDCVLEAGRYTLLDDRAGPGLLPAAEEHGVGVMAAGVFNSGILADPNAEATFNYRPAPAELLERARRLQAFAAERDLPLTRLALRYPLRAPAVSSILVGARSPEEIEQNLAEYKAPVPDEVWEDLEASGLTHWVSPE